MTTGIERTYREEYSAAIAATANEAEQAYLSRHRGSLAPAPR